MGICAHKNIVEPSDAGKHAMFLSNGQPDRLNSDSWKYGNISKDETKENKTTTSNRDRDKRIRRAQTIDRRHRKDHVPDAPLAQISTKKKTLKDMDNIIKALNKHFIFACLNEDNRKSMIEQMVYYSMQANQMIFEQGQIGHNFFIIEKGKVEVIVNGNRVNVLETGESFGELGLLHDAPRTATIITLEPTCMWGLNRDNFTNAVEAVNSFNYNENKQFIERVPLLSMLTPPQQEILLDCLSTLNFTNGQRIVNEGDPGNLFYIIKEGEVSCVQNGREIRKMYKGEFFGEQALLYNCPRTATITALGDVKCIAISREKLTKVLGSQLQQLIYKNSQMMTIDKSPILNKLTKEQAERLIQLMRVKSFEPGQVVISTGTPKGVKIWLVLKGCLIQGGKIVADLFSCIGDNEIIKKPEGEFEEDIIAFDSVDVSEINKAMFEQCIGGKYETVTANNEALELLKRVQLLRSLSPKKLQSLIPVLKIQQFQASETIVRENDVGETFYIIKEGRVDVMKNGGRVRSITKNDYFGERSVLFSVFRSATVVAQEPVTCWVVSKEDFMQIINKHVRFQMLKRIELQDDDISLNDLNIVKVLGKGMFGIVFLAIHKIKHRLYALKTVSRRKITSYELQEYLTLERKILLQIDHILIIKLIKTFKDDKRIYFLTEYVRGKDLFSILIDMGLLKDEDAKFYTSCLLLMLEYLHERDIVHRDLKPENVMVDEEGYLKLIDFGTAKVVEGRTYSRLGTPYYMAPEVITGDGYNTPADIWSLGIMLYEFLCGNVPFGVEEEDPYVIYNKVLEGRLRYPQWIISRLKCRTLIEQLLNRNPALRAGGSIDNLKHHSWFVGVNWDKILGRSAKAPHIPDIRSFENEISQAIKAQESYDVVISRYESQEDVPDRTSSRNKYLPDWDAEF
jgi:cGMP-dependent protein kinase